MEPGRPNLKLTGTAVFRNSYKSRLVAALNLGSNSSITGEYYHHFGGTAYSIGPGVSLERAHFSQYVEDNRLDAGRDRFLKAIDGMPFGPSRSQGVLKGNRFYHSDLAFTLAFPSGMFR